MKIKSALLLSFLVFACNNDPESDTENPVSTIPAPTALSYSLLKVYPHDTAAFTEGLQFVNGFLYEGTGLENQSFLRKVELETGKILQEHKLSSQFFGEGITVLNNKVYQITYKNKLGFIYNLSDFKQLSTFDYNIDGWGMTNDGTHLIVSDGSNNIYYWDPATIQEVKRISVQDNNGMKNNINELEFINGFIYANVWQTDEILKIDTATGNVVGRLDLSNLKTSYPELEDPEKNKVLNGIAWDSAGNRLFITGKNWPKLFEIKLN